MPVCLDPAHRSGYEGPTGDDMNVLFVEDEPEPRTVTAEVMRGLGHAVIDVDSAENALALLRKIALDAMVTDVGLPVMPGDVLAPEARALQPKVRILFVTRV